MSRSPVIEHRVDIASTREILFISTVFSLILYFVYPSDMLKEQVLKEKSNYALSALYLENMLELDPDNKELIFAAVKADLSSGRTDLAAKLIEVLKTASSRVEQKKIDILEYKLYSVQRGKARDANESMQIDQKMDRLINRVSKSGNFDKEYAFWWYKNALAHSQKKAALVFIRPVYEQGNSHALEACVTLTGDLNRSKEKIYCIQKLIDLDDNRSEQWLESAYVMYSNSGEIAQAYKMIKKLAAIDPAYASELARVELMGEHYIDSSKSFMLLYRESSDPKKKRQYLLNAIQVLVDGEKGDEAVVLIKKYEDDYLKDAMMSQKFLKFYLAIDRLQDARELSIKLMKDESFE